MSSPVVSVDLGATHLRIAVTAGMHVDPVHTLRTAELGSLPADPGGIVPDVARAVAQVVERAALDVPPSEWPVAVGIGVAAFVDPAGDLISPTPFGVPAGRLLRNALERALGVPTILDNDANMAALGELAAGAGRASPDFVLITLGTNIGGAIVERGRIRRGAHGIAGEVGLILAPSEVGSGRPALEGDASLPAVPGGPAARGYAYLEDLVGGRALARRARGAHADPGLAEPAVFAAARRGDPGAREAVAAAIEGWAVLIADVSVVVDPPVLILSGGLVEEAAQFLDPLRRRVGELTPFAPEIRIGELGASAGLVGAAVAARSVAGTHEARHGDGAATAT